MISSNDLGGLMAMMPAFATDDAADFKASNTVSVERLEKGLNRMVDDGANVVAVAGSFGEFHTLLDNEFESLARSSAEINNKRAALFIGTTALNTRDAYRRMKMVAQTRADGVLMGVPFYFPSSPQNAIRFYRDMAAEFPNLGIMIYHNPPLHNVRLTVEMLAEISKIPQIVATKDSHRDPIEFMRLTETVKGKMSIFVNQTQYMAYQPLGAAGFWSIDAWMGPWPVLALRDAVKRGDWELAKQITLEIAPQTSGAKNRSWRETAAKIAVRYAGYVDPGPLRPPFVEIPKEVAEATQKKAERWTRLCEKYRNKAAVPA
jgi:dihydrodipicolinate synthase/N-acetylneuraminate lyase